MLVLLPCAFPVDGGSVSVLRVLDPFSPIGCERVCGWVPPTCDATYSVVVDIDWG